MQGKQDNTDPLEQLRVIDVLEIGPARVENRRLKSSYTIEQNGKRDETDLVITYEERVFDPDGAADLNLANMIAAQVAVNYGLFCNRIVFRGEYDAADSRFIRDMVENTAREIYLKKFLEPNPFVISDMVEMPAERHRTYSNAVLEFPDTIKDKSINWNPVDIRPDRVAVSSSGGKDSLLSFGLLRELGYEVHPVFGNESGRHWFTALNAFRDFANHIPNTTRVWMNSDRLFTFMLRHLPFVRADFANLRSDEYPIRLWTVAVFLFGALPILRSRGISRLVIGNEFDTTDRKIHKGIRHYNGLFDQSRYFDKLLSRYYARKKWRLSQFSILRPLSEVLIQKILVHRYPDLFRNQTSCHATHKKNERVYPCGKCEKCRRIVTMILAVGGDPSMCGYARDQVDKCVETFSTRGVQQEQAGAEHLTWMLRKRGIIDKKGSSHHKARKHPEIMKLRFDREHSPMDTIPVDLRVPLYRILLQHADGAARREGRTWSDINVFDDSALRRPYAFERGATRKTTPTHGSVGVRGFVLSEMTWPEAQKRFGEVDIALLPVGATEQHGPHLPLDTDAFDADYLARAVAGRCSDPKPIVLPLVPYGVSYHHEGFSGTISIANQTLSRLVYDIGLSSARNGITKLIIINGHGGNEPALNYAAQEINRDAHIFVAVDSGETSDVDVYEMIDTPNDVHAGEIETSTSLAIRPELVRLDRVEKLVPEFSSRYLNFTSKRGVSWHAFTRKISESGVMGDPTRASAEKGRKMWEVMIEHLVTFVEDLKQLTLDEIHNRKY